MLTVGLRGTLSVSKSTLEGAKLRTHVRWIDLQMAPGRPVDLVLQLAGDETAAALPCNNALVVAWASVPAADAIEDALQNALIQAYGFVVGYGDAMHRVCRWVQILAHSITQTLDARGLIVGETGVGKELAARAVHRMGARRGEPFVAINCGALPRELVASELFGHVRGAFTGANASRAGALSRAGEGVVFLDEVGELPLELQPSLLRVLEERMFVPVGGDAEVALRAQVLSATNQDVARLVKEGRMRPDLFFRLSQLVVEIPSLSQRRDDIPLLVRYFWQRAGDAPLPSALLKSAEISSWPGNIRQLRHVVERVMLLQQTLGAGHVEEAFDSVSNEPVAHVGTLAVLRNQFEREVLRAVMRRVRGNLDSVAAELGITKRSVYNLLKRHGIDVGEGSDVH